MSSFPTCHKPSGAHVSCVEKIKVLNENFGELRNLAQETLDDALLLGCSEAQARESIQNMLDGLTASYEEIQE